MIEGNTQGMRRAHLRELESLVGKKSAAFCDPEILEPTARISACYHREIMLNISRGGVVLDVTVGDDRSVRAGRNSEREGRLSGVRSVHTHPRGTAALSELDISCLVGTRSDALAVAALDGDGAVTGCVTAYYTPDGIEQLRSPDLVDPRLLTQILETDARWKKLKPGSAANAAPRERAVLVGVAVGEESMAELGELAVSAGAEVVAVLTQNARPHPATMVGRGKVEEIAAEIQKHAADLVIFDNELSGSQAARLENALGVKVIDRSNLILDIFAARASSTEGKLQVELAQLEYNLPRLIGAGASLDKMRAGIGMRGPGEKKLETDRRRIRAEIVKLRARLAKLAGERDLRRARRVSGALPQVALVGYTNAGKSTLLNALARSDAYVADRLFATLDPLTRRVDDGETSFLLTDTVGFVSKLPHQFIDAFSSTLEEARTADLLLIVLDAHDPAVAQKRAVVEDVLARIGAACNPRLYVYNKIDLGAVCDLNDGIAVSALGGDGIDSLRARIVAAVGSRPVPPAGSRRRTAPKSPVGARIS